jgi:glucose/arabinose dehydrogenase
VTQPNYLQNLRRAFTVGAAFASFMAAPTLATAANPAKSPYPLDAPSLAQGQALFTQWCASCHLIARDAIGPPLGGVTQILTRTELLRQIRQPEAVIASGNPRAAALFQRYKVMMPAFTALSEAQIITILAYLDNETTHSQIKPLAVNLDPSLKDAGRFAPPVQKSGIVIELEDFIQVPLAPNRRPDKGIATLRASPTLDGALFISDQMGVIYRVKNREVRVFLDIRDRLPNFAYEPGIGTGLGSFTFHPDFLRNGLLYTTHAEPTKKNPAINDDWYAQIPLAESASPTLHWVLSEWRLTDPASVIFTGTRREVLRLKTPTTAHGCQDIAFAPIRDQQDPDYGLLFIGVGDGGAVNLKMPELAHTPRSLLGTLMRIDPRGHNAPNGQYGIPKDNPFASQADPLARPEIWAWGFRNPHRMCWDLTYGKRLLLTDIGEANVEEINLIEKGGDYGWNKIEGSSRIDVMRDAKVVYPATAAELARYRLPLGSLDHTDARAISGGFVYLGPIKVLQHKYIFGDIVTGRLFYMKVDASLADTQIYELNIVRDGLATSLATLANTKRAHLRIGYDEPTGDMYIMTKEDGWLRRVTTAYPR